MSESVISLFTRVAKDFSPELKIDAPEGRDSEAVHNFYFRNTVVMRSILTVKFSDIQHYDGATWVDKKKLEI